VRKLGHVWNSESRKLVGGFVGEHGVRISGFVTPKERFDIVYIGPEEA
ncbi:hypothetical protein LINGRAHAP2_LOCUS15909, partial [Linum grandiflorum]